MNPGKPPINAEEFADVAISVICGAMAQAVRDALRARVPVADVLYHNGKAAAVEFIWSHRDEIFDRWTKVISDNDRISFCGKLPFVGPVTKWDLAKRLGVRCEPVMESAAHE